MELVRVPLDGVECIAGAKACLILKVHVRLEVGWGGVDGMGWSGPVAV